MIVDIPKSNLKALEKRLGRLANRAREHGMPDVAFRVIEEIRRDLSVLDQFGRARGDADAIRTVGVTMARVELTGAAPWVGEWEVVGTRRAYRKSDRVVVADFGDIPEDKKACALGCDHCNTVRKRQTSYWLRRKDGQREVEIGSTCLGDFVGSEVSPRAIEGLDIRSKMACEVMEAADPYWRHGGPQEVLEESKLVLAVANRVVQEHGWVSSSHARASGLEASWRIVGRALDLSRSAEGLTVDSMLPTAADFIVAEDAMKWFREGSADNPFLEEACLALDAGLVGTRQLSVLVAGMAQYRRHLTRSAERKREELLGAGSAHVGSVGDRIDRVVAVRRMHPYVSKFGGGYVINMNDADGNLYVWLTGSKVAMDVGHCYEVRGTVKGHGKAGVKKDGGAETTLTRVSIIADLGPGELVPTSVDAMSVEDEAALDSMLFSPEPAV